MNIRIGRATGDEQWAPVSDLMAGLMLVFMFIAVIRTADFMEEKESYKEECQKIYWELNSLKDDFEEEEVMLLEDMAIRFPKVRFRPGSYDIPDRYRQILVKFWPRYMKIVQSEKYREDIREIRIEGHTSSEFIGAYGDKDAYYKNMALSQSRTREILKFVLGLPNSEEHFDWAKDHITANGLSSSRLIYNTEGKENKEESRRVEFRLLTEACRRAGVYEPTTGNDIGE